MKRLILFTVFALFLGLSTAELLSLWRADWVRDQSAVVFVRSVKDEKPTAPLEKPAELDLKKMLEVQSADH